MKKIVVKFGGSNLKTKEDISRLIEVVSCYQVPLVIVISALYGVTDLLVKAVDEVLEDEQAIDKIKNQLFDIHHQIITMYIKNKPLQKEIQTMLKGRIDQLGKYLMGIHCLGQVPDFAKDMILSYGERLSSLLLYSLLKYRSFDSQELMPEDIGLITDGEYGDATVDIIKSEPGVRKSLTEDKIFVIPGFYGISEDGKVTLLGRGGTDYSASAIARCIDALSVDIWKDVAGFMSADPKIVSNPVIIEKLTYREAAELSYFGARILHPKTFEPLADDGIPINLFDITHFGHKIEPITVISKDGTISGDIVKSVTFSDDIGILKLRGAGVGIKPGIMAKVTNRLSQANINIKSIITSQTSINILLSTRDLARSYRLISDVALAAVDEILKVEKVSLIAVVGEGMLEMPGIAARVFTAVSRQNINIQIISAGASAVATYFIIDQHDKARAIKAVHKEFFYENNTGNQ